MKDKNLPTVDVTVIWKDEPDVEYNYIIAIGEYEGDVYTHDEEIFFYVNNYDELKALEDPENGEDFYIKI